jgi:ubiquinone/menaquinone biosynthesis C-methylase UbiE
MIIMANFVDNYCEFPTVLRRPMWQIWHRLLSKFDKDSTVNFMNYGYAELNGAEPIKLKNEDEINRYCIQLYDTVAKGTNLKDKNVLEVGSGRGGGANYIARYHKTKSYIGIDISSDVINFCNKTYNVPGLNFKKGRAEKLPIDSESFDAVVNVESARCYSDIELFFSEVHRSLNEDGYFLFADMIEKEEVNEIKNKIRKNGFYILSEKDITKNVAKGLELDTLRREKIIKRRVPGFLRNSFKKFAGTKGTKRYNSFSNGKFEYWNFVLQKKDH